MCENCGCGHVETFKVIPMQDAPGENARLAGASHQHVHEHVDADGRRYTHVHSHSHDATALHEHTHGHGEIHAHAGEELIQTVPVHLPILIKNDRLAERNRGYLNATGTIAINLVSSPGSGKTMFLAKTLELLNGKVSAAVIVGDLETANDAERLRGKGAPVVQVTTGTVCHLDAEMISSGMEQLDLNICRILFIENVGNLVCPASYDLGESMRVVLISVTEGEDKPLKYPPIFRGARFVVISKTDLLSASGIDIATLRRNIHAVAPEATVVEVSARTGEGMQVWIAILNSLGENPR